MSLKPLDEIAREDRAAISAIDVQECHDQNGNVTRRIHKIRLERKQAAARNPG